ncbi:MAG: NADH-quinone oxidoreductase subunit NuoH [Dermatophilus congolensis]|nr:NADH-quinone oxidoreductase subunit NuoH [Dermatophilus congolensis]
MSALTGLAAGAGTLATLEHPVADFSDTPWWLSLIKALLIFVYLMLQVVVVIWFERRVIGLMQQRPGPNRLGPLGLGQTLADGFKLMWKETIVPDQADRKLYHIAPMIIGSCAFIAFAIIPVGGTVQMFGHTTPLQLTDSPASSLLVLAAAGLSVYGFVFMGWSSGSPFPLLGGLRSSAQLISYEIAMGLSLVAVFLYAGSMSTSSIVAAQANMWFIIPAIFSFVVFVICMFGETNRNPFDLPEGEGEIVGGPHTEYAGMGFGMYFLGEYVNMFTVSALGATLFLGGPSAPPGIAAIGDGMFNTGWWGVLWLTMKLWLFMFLFVWVRGSLPRTRYDQFMRFGWKVLIPATLVWAMAVIFIRAAQLQFLGENTMLMTMVVVGVVAVIALAAAWIWDSKREQATRREPPAAEIDPFVGGFPVPPLPGQRLREPTRASGAASIARSQTPVTDSTEEA